MMRLLRWLNLRLGFGREEQEVLAEVFFADHPECEMPSHVRVESVSYIRYGLLAQILAWKRGPQITVNGLIDPNFGKSQSKAE